MFVEFVDNSPSESGAMTMLSLKNTRNSSCSLRHIVIFGYCLALALGSSNSRSRSLNSTDSLMCSWAEDDSSSYHASTADEEERILSALTLLQDDGKESSHYRPKTRGLTPLQDYLDDLRDMDELPKRRRKRRVKKKRKSVKSSNSKCAEEHANPVAPMAISNPLMETPKRLDPAANELEESEKGPRLWESYTRSSDNVLLSTQPSLRATAVNASKGSHMPTELEILPRRPASPGMVSKHHLNHIHNTPVQARSSATSSTTFWVRRYLNARPKDVLLPVPKEYIADGFNLAQLAPIVERIGFQVMGAQAVEVAKRLVELPSPQPSFPIYRLALQLLLNEDEAEEPNILTHPLIPPEAIQQAAEALYLIVHARFVTSPRGLDALRRILLNSPVFGKCPRPQCEGTMLLPYGVSNDFTSNSHACQRYCACCGNLWNCWESKTDGCAWGPSLCFLLLMAHGHELFPAAAGRQVSTEMLYHPNDPRVFGFRIHPAVTWGQPLSR